MSACTVMVSRTSPVSVVSIPSLASTAACRPSGQRCRAAMRPREELMRCTAPSRTM
ncbi:Uncharacterised protein [Mycobacteroides abscessus subsp. abscessus]|nr:Uncharacterised protein [Mycobacteroides abscessus subsp. abscessus]SKU63349.1 Uncharacterised protein [Mycobacteroides abscessus subsp. abscessus]SKU63451.1 Uncharacterised protein [Mycobacteroides abscessus subsp. abscessus]